MNTKRYHIVMITPHYQKRMATLGRTLRCHATGCPDPGAGMRPGGQIVTNTRRVYHVGCARKKNITYDDQ